MLNVTISFLSDLSVGVFSVVPDIAWKLLVTWEAGLFACKLIK